MYLIRKITPYVDGIVGADFHLSFLQRIKILFSKGISLVLVSDKIFKNEAGQKNGFIKENENEIL